MSDRYASATVLNGPQEASKVDKMEELWHTVPHSLTAVVFVALTSSFVTSVWAISEPLSRTTIRLIVEMVDDPSDGHRGRCHFALLTPVDNMAA